MYRPAHAFPFPHGEHLSAAIDERGNNVYYSRLPADLRGSVSGNSLS
jgi:hypothetical protein